MMLMMQEQIREGTVIEKNQRMKGKEKRKKGLLTMVWDD